jgi:putative ATP-dependent endonuclease of the OLD family
VILVEGVAEQLLVPEFARRLRAPLAPAGVSVINVGGVAFPPFTDLFGSGKLPYRLAVVSDADPEESDEELDEAVEALSARSVRLKERLRGSDNAEAFFSERTLEWDLALIPANRPLMVEALRPFKPRVAAKLEGELEDLDDEAAAERMLEAIGRVKGPFAQELAELLADDENQFEVPPYLDRAIGWAVQDAVFVDAPDGDLAGEAGGDSDGSP